MTFNFCQPKVLADLNSKTFPNGKRYYTLEDGTQLPSATTVLGAQKKHTSVVSIEPNDDDEWIYMFEDYTNL